MSSYQTNYIYSSKIRLMVFLALLLSVNGCSRTDREKAVYSFVEEGVSLAESHDVGRLMDLTDENLVIGPGKHSRKEVRRVLFVMLKRYGHFRIHYPQPSVKLSDDEQRAIVKMNLLIANKNQLFPDLDLLYQDSAAWLQTVDENADLYTLSMELNFDSGDWLLKKARITKFGRPHGIMQ